MNLTPKLSKAGKKTETGNNIRVQSYFPPTQRRSHRGTLTHDSVVFIRMKCRPLTHLPK